MSQTVKGRGNLHILLQIANYACVESGVFAKREQCNYFQEAQI